MPDTFTDQLSRLAPTVDAAAGRELFERARSGGSPTPRWRLAAAVVLLLAAGVVGLWAVARDGDDPMTPAAPADDGSTVFEVRLVEQTDEAFGVLAAFDSADELAASRAPDRLGTTIDWDRQIALVATMPDNACPDTLVRFDVDGDVWTPVFEEQATACEDPLLSWLYGVAIDRSALPPRVTFRLPGDELYDLPERAATISVTPATGRPSSPDPVALDPTGVVVPLPPVGEPELHVGTALDPFWVVHHDDGTVSVLRAVVPAPVDEDRGVTGLARLAMMAEDGRGFAAERWIYDDHGRTVNGPRSQDLAGFAGEITDEGVAILRSDATRIAGDAGAPSSAGYRPPDTRSAIDLQTLMTLSYSGPIWRFLDATLVVEDGTGTICAVEPDVPVDRLDTCSDGLATGVGSDQLDITTWFTAPLLTEFDEFGRIGRVVPLGGLMSRNDAVVDGFLPVEPIAVVDTSSALPIRIVTEIDAAELPELRNVDLSAVAWDEVHVLIVTIEGSGCPIAVTGLSPFGDDRWTVEAQQQGTACRAQLTRWLNVVPVPRALLPSDATIDFEGDTATWP